MSYTNAEYITGIVTATHGLDSTPWEGIFYDLLIMYPASVAGPVPNVQPVRKFDAGMKIHPAAPGEPFYGSMIDGVLKVCVPEGVKFSPCGAGAAPATGGMLQTIRNLLERATGGGTAVSPGGGSEG